MVQKIWGLKCLTYGRTSSKQICPPTSNSWDIVGLVKPSMNAHIGLSPNKNQRRREGNLVIFYKAAYILDVNKSHSNIYLGDVKHVWNHCFVPVWCNRFLHVKIFACKQQSWKIFARERIITSIYIYVLKILLSAAKLRSCRNPGSNRGPLDLQSNALPTELFRLTFIAISAAVLTTANLLIQ